MNITITKVLISVFKNHKFFSKNITTYRDTVYHFKIYRFLTVFSLRNFGHVTGSPQTWYAHTVYHYP